MVFSAGFSGNRGKSSSNRPLTGEIGLLSSKLCTISSKLSTSLVKLALLLGIMLEICIDMVKF